MSSSTWPSPKERRKRMMLDFSSGRVNMREQPRRLKIGDPVPDFAMTSQDGKLVKLSELRGNVVVLTFIYTRCPLPDFCPLMDRKFSELAQRVSAFPERAKHIRMISLSFDPEHDTPDILRKHAEIRGATPPLWSYAVASHAELAKIAAPLGLLYGPAKTKSPTTSARRSSTARENWPVSKSERPQQMGSRRPFEDNLCSDPAFRTLKPGSPPPDPSTPAALAATFISAHIWGFESSPGSRFGPLRCSWLARTSVTNQSAKRLQITVDSC